MTTVSGQNVIRTVHGRGYRFVADIAERASRPQPAETPTADFVGRNAELAMLWMVCDLTGECWHSSARYADPIEFVLPNRK